MDSYPRRLNWGCGPVIADGWVNVDRERLWALGAPELSDLVVHDITAERLPFPDGFFDGIVANHSFQCLTLDEGPPAAEEFARVLARGGRLRLIVPDVVAALDAFYRGDGTWPGFAAISEPWPLQRRFLHYLTWGGQNRRCFDLEQLQEVCLDAGLVLATVPDPEMRWMTEIDSRHGESLFVEAVKP